MTMATIRQARERDIGALVRMRWDFTWENRAEAAEGYDRFEAECRAFLTEAMKSGRWCIWVAEADGMVISHIYVQLIDKVPRPGRETRPFGYVTNVYTVPACRSRRIGSLLMEAVRQWARENDLEFLIVWPAEESVVFYQRAGFRPCTEPMELFFGGEM